MKTEVIVRGGDIILDRWMNEAAKETLVSNQGAYEGELLCNYEDREQWVRDPLKCSNWQELEALQIVLERNALLLWAIVGQEEDRSSGFPIRYIEIALAIPKAFLKADT